MRRPTRRRRRAARGELVVVTGMTGAGRSTAAKELEDLGFYVVDNLPPTLLRDVVRAGRREPGRRAADRGRGRRPLRLVLRRPCRRTSPRARPAGAPRWSSSRPTDDVLVRRQEAARRPHPLQGGGRLLDGLQRERVGARPTCAATPTWSSTPPTSTCTSSPTGSPRRSGPPTRSRLQGHGGQLRLQVRHPRRRRLRRRHALPAQPVLGARAARRRPAATATVADYVLEPAGRRGRSSTSYVPVAGDRRRGLPRARASAS